jgi:cellulose 1,4-beta-cellobiosidase
MDIWEANNAATAFTPHPCNTTQVYACQGPDCGNGDNRYTGVCDKDGCDMNAYRMGDKSFYGFGANYSVDTSKKFTVVTQFYTLGNQANGTLGEIRRLYIQNGTVIQNAKVKIPGMDKDDSISDRYCRATKTVLGGADAFTQQGGLTQMGKALARGMVLALSIWDDATSHMGWLDSTFPTDADPNTPGVARGPCPISGGVPSELIQNYPGAKVVFSNIRSGDIGSTYNGKLQSRGPYRYHRL